VYTRLSNLFRRFRRNQKGATAIEFAIVALPFFTLLFAIIEHSLLFFGAQTLDNAVMQTGRLIRTGQVQSQGIGETQFRDLVCAEIDFLMDCGERLKIDVRTFDDFAGVTPNAPLDEDGSYSGDFTFDAGAGGEIVLVRVFYSWPVVTPMFSEHVSNMSDGSYLLSASAAFRNEPF
jgi:Flp pilus assembly protein TadG